MKEEIKKVISGYLMDISKGYLDGKDWVFPNQESFESDLDLLQCEGETHKYTFAGKHRKSGGYVEYVLFCEKCGEYKSSRGSFSGEKLR